MKRILGILMLAAAFAAGTVAIGWWAVPIIGAAWGIAAAPDKRPARVAGVAAVLAWATLLCVAMVSADGMWVATKVGAIMRFSAGGFILVTLVFPLALAMAAAGMTSAFRAKQA